MFAQARTSHAPERRRRWIAEFFDDLPPEAPLHMPDQCLRTAPDAALRPASDASLRLGGLILATAILTGAALIPVYQLLARDDIGPLDPVILATVGLLFAWSAFSFLSALAGFFAAAPSRASLPELDDGAPLPWLSSRTAVLLPIYNEAPQPVFSRLHAICESVAAAGGAGRFDFFVLSDTTSRGILATEYGLFQRLRLRLGAGARVFYRHRPENLGRKAGNIAEWVRRFGGAYDFMAVLDADSLIEGETLVRLAGAMERGRDIGLIQTAPSIVNRHTLFSRAEQFASRLYGPLLAHGIAWWSGSEGNYWGHNAVIRVKAFAAHAGLPRLRGPQPFGGHVLSHDFVEAALIRRAGWRVVLAPRLGGSYEESPPTLGGLMARDRRWSQGNLQHLPLTFARGLHWISRFHLIRGISAYLVAPLWLLLVAAAVALPLHPEWGAGAGASRLAAGVRIFDQEAMGVAFSVAIGFLLVPKLLAFARMLGAPEERRLFGGARRAALSIAVETLVSTLVAPLIMVSHTRSLASPRSPISSTRSAVQTSRCASSAFTKSSDATRTPNAT